MTLEHSPQAPDGRSLERADNRTAGIVADFWTSLLPTTRETYRKSFRALARWRGLAGELEAAAWFLTLEHGDANRTAAAWRGAMLEEGLAPATAEVRVSALRSLVTAANLAGERAWKLTLPPMRSARVVRLRNTRGPGAAAVARLLAVASLEERAVLHLLAYRGLRAGMVASLRLEHLETGDTPAVWTAGKGRGQQRERQPIHSSTAAAIVEWTAAGAVTSPGDDLFPSFTTARAIGDMVRKVARRAGVPAFRPHGLRHFAITRALEVTGGDVRAVQAFSGHKDPRTVMAYDDGRKDLAGDVARRVVDETPSTP